MKKVKGVIKKVDRDQVTILSNGNRIIVSRNIIPNKKEGEEIVLLFLSQEEDRRKSNEIAKELLREALRRE